MLDLFPLTVNGKVDRKALPEAEARGDADSYQAPRTAVESLLGEIWAQAEVLGVENLGVHDNFFELGGHSLLATRVMSRACGRPSTSRCRCGVRSRRRRLRRWPSASNRRSTATRAPADPIAPVARTGPMPVSYAQQRLWFLDRLEPGSPTYNVPFVLSLTGALNVDALESSLAELVRRHEVLRTRFVTIGDEPFQQVDPIDDVVQFSLERVECVSEEQAQLWAQREARRPFDLSTGPLFRGALLALGEHEHWLMLVMHHVVIDGWAVGILLNELTALYRAACNREADELRAACRCSTPTTRRGSGSG